MFTLCNMRPLSIREPPPPDRRGGGVRGVLPPALAEYVLLKRYTQCLLPPWLLCLGVKGQGYRETKCGILIDLRPSVRYSCGGGMHTDRWCGVEADLFSIYLSEPILPVTESQTDWVGDKPAMMPWNGRVSLSNLSLSAPTCTRACLLNVVSWWPPQPLITHIRKYLMSSYGQNLCYGC